MNASLLGMGRLLRRPSAMLLSALTVALIGVGYMAPGAAQEPTLTVSATTDLVAGQVIHIDAEVPAGTLSGVGICPEDAVLTDLISAQSTCLSLESLGGPVYSIDHAVTRTIQTQSALHDCAVVQCSVVVVYSVDFSGIGTEWVSVPLSFAFPGPIVAVAPVAFLDDLDSVSVSFNDAQAGVSVRAVQCVVEAAPLPDGAPGACLDLGPLGGTPPDVAASVQVQRFLTDSAGITRDCELVECQLGVAVGDGSLDYFLKRIRFDNSPLLEVTPSTGLETGDVIHVDALVPAGLSSGVGICGPHSDLTSLFSAATSCRSLATLGGPAYSLDHVVERVSVFGGQTVDCFVVQCSVVVVAATDFFSLDFFASVPLVFSQPPPEARVEPSSILRDRSPIKVLFNAANGTPVTGVACVVESVPLPDGAPGACDELGLLEGEEPNVSLDTAAQRWIVDSGGTRQDCFAVTCQVGVRVGSGAVDYFLADVSFTDAPAVGLDPQPRLLDEGDSITFTANNLPIDHVNTTVLLCGSIVGTPRPPSAAPIPTHRYRRLADLPTRARLPHNASRRSTAPPTTVRRAPAPARSAVRLQLWDTTRRVMRRPHSCTRCRIDCASCLT